MQDTQRRSGTRPPLRTHYVLNKFDKILNYGLALDYDASLSQLLDGGLNIENWPELFYIYKADLYLNNFQILILVWFKHIYSV